MTLEAVPRDPGARIALYPGSFDPVHNGHVDVIHRAAHLFDEVIVAVYDRPDKRLFFSTSERVELVREAVADLPNVKVASYAILTVDYAVECGARAIVRGLRATSDFEFEFQLALMNRHLNHNVEALFLMTALEHAHLSSSLVKEITQLGASPDGLVPPGVAEALRRKYERST
jgi:pantetheine-phosphate adenylyltransferase